MQWRFLSESDSNALINTRRLNAASIVLKMEMDEILGEDLVDGTIKDVQMSEPAQQVGAYLERKNQPDEGLIVTAGIEHLKFGSFAGNALVEKKAVIAETTDGKRSTEMQTILSE